MSYSYCEWNNGGADCFLDLTKSVSEPLYMSVVVIVMLQEKRIKRKYSDIAKFFAEMKIITVTNKKRKTPGECIFLLTSEL